MTLVPLVSRELLCCCRRLSAVSLSLSILKMGSSFSSFLSTVAADGSGINNRSGNGKDKDDKIVRNKSRDHLQLTSNQQREPDVHKMNVTHISDISPTVKKLVLHTHVRPVPIDFKAGQWVDLFIPGIEQVGGFSVCSSPLYLKRTGNLHLAVKYAKWPPAYWVHSKCKVGSELSIRVGGDFFFDTANPNNSEKIVLLLGGGVGINPLASIVAQIHQYKNADESNDASKLKTLLIFSAKTEEELLFLDIFEETSRMDKFFQAQYFLTGNQSSSRLKTGSTVKYHRIGSSDIEKGITTHLNLALGSQEMKTRLLVYICGPPPMIQTMESILQSLGVSNIFYEKWW